jgi:glycosyltransferase involved in cell wall biosynthesis
MHSSLPQQVSNFGYAKSTWLTRILARVERLMVRRSRVVIVICEDLVTTVRDIKADVPTVLIENAPGSGDKPAAGTGRAVRDALGLGAETPVVLYTGTFEAYQGLDLLYDAMAVVHRARPEARLVMVGGEPEQVEQARRAVASRGIADIVIFTGQKPAEDIPQYLDAATVLASPRSTGTNTPLKIYQYLRSGRPIVATRLRTHTQVLNDRVAFLGEPTPAGLGAALLAAIENPARADMVGREAQSLANTKYSDEAFIAKTGQACDLLFANGVPGTARGRDSLA